MFKKKNIKKYWKKNWHWMAVVLLSVVFFIGTGSYNYFTQSYASDNDKQIDFVKWGSPDETANYIFAKLYGQTGELKIFEKYNLYTKDIMHPRSFRSDYGELKPVSFLGIILIYGSIIKLTTYKILPYLTPLFAGVGLIYFYYLIKKLFGKTNAIISVFLLASLPPFIYYSARSMFHNVLFTVLVIIALYYSVAMINNQKNKAKIKKQKTGQLFADFFKRNKNYNNKKNNFINLFFAGLAGIFWGLAVITRTSELIWILPLLFILWIFNIKKIGIVKLIIFICFFGTAILPAVFYNKILYGSYISGGYVEMNQSIASVSKAGADLISRTSNGVSINYKELLSQVKTNIFHFGFFPKHSLQMGQKYFVEMFYWIFWFAVFGFILFLTKWRQRRPKHWLYIVSLAVISGILLFYYGSWEFHDNPDPKSFTIGNSYTRYWLPIYMGAIPFASYFIMRLTKAINDLICKIRSKNKDKFLSFHFSKKFSLSSLRAVSVMIIIYISLAFVLFGSEEGLIFQTNKSVPIKSEWRKVLSLTESNSTIITRYHDKLFFPERKVIVGLFNDSNMIREYANLVELLPVYYYNFTLPEKDFNYLNNRRLAEFGLGIEIVEKITNDFTLYKFYKSEKEIEVEVNMVENEI